MITAVWSEAIAKKVDERSIAAAGSARNLMEAAGYWTAISIASRTQPGQRIVVLCGPGNNGGDGLVAARYLFGWGFKVHIVHMVAKAQTTTLDRQAQADKAASLGIHQLKMTEVKDELLRDAVVIDGVFGIGLQGPLRDGPQKTLLQRIAQAPTSCVLAIDLPSGILCDLWEQDAPPLPAHVTISFGAKKPAHLLYPSAGYCGTTLVRNIGFLEQAKTECWEASPVKLCEWKDESPDPWRYLGEDAHKYQRGHVLVIGGSSGKWGAPILSAIAAAQGGAGWVSLACPQFGLPVPPHIVQEDLFLKGHLNLPKLRSFVAERRVRSLLLGPGMVKSPLDPQLSSYLKELSHQGVAIILDAGACHRLGTDSDGSLFNPNRTLLTPHPGEFAKSGILDGGVNGLVDLPLLVDAMKKIGACLFYKTASPLCVSPHLDFIPLRKIGNPTLGKAGSGDVLAGLCAALALTPCPLWQVPFVGMAAQIHTLRGLIDSGLQQPTPLDIAQAIRYQRS